MLSKLLSATSTQSAGNWRLTGQGALLKRGAISRRIRRATVKTLKRCDYLQELHRMSRSSLWGNKSNTAAQSTSLNKINY